MNQTLSNEPQLNALMDAMVEAFIISDSKGNIERFNKSAETIFGYSAAEMIGRNVSILMTPFDEKQHDQYMAHSHETGEKQIIGIGREVMARRKDGSEFPADLAIGEVRWNNNSRFIGLIRDISDRKFAEEQAIKRQEEVINTSRLTTMGEMAAAMAHELNQPLTAISNYASACMKSMDSDKPGRIDVRGTLQLIDDQAHRAGEVIKRLRTFVKFDDSRREPTSLSLLAEEIMPLAALDAKANNISLTVEIPDNMPSIVVDSLQIQQVILNLLRNGVDAMKQCDAQHRGMRLAAYAANPETITVEVSDEGTGIDKDTADMLFNAFFTTKETGMGMGLSICKTIINAHGGEMTFKNNPERGATFSFTLPTRYE
jgi:two-component system sensor kinase FixL